MPRTAVRSTPTIGSDIDALFDLREKKRKLEAAIKDLDGQAEAIESRLLETMNSMATDKGAGSRATASVSSTTVANVEDWDLFHEYIRKNKFFHLLQRRVSDPAYRELLEAGKKVPGVQPFTRRRLNIRARS